MPALTFTRPAQLHTRRLEAELAAANIPAQHATMEGAQLVIGGPSLDDSHRAAIQAVLDAHTGPTEEDTRPQAVRTKILDALAQVENAASVKATWDGLTAAQRQEANRRVALGFCKLARLVLGQLDIPE